MAGGPRLDMVGGSGIDVPDGLRAWCIDGRIVALAIGTNVAPGKDCIDPFIALRAAWHRCRTAGRCRATGMSVDLGSDLT